VTYRPADTDEYVFYLGPDIDLELRGPGASALTPTHREVVTTCAGLRTAFVYQLVEATKYELTLRATAHVTSALLLVEHVTPLSPAGWENRLEACE
jgi:hypothetical protein